MPPLPVLTPMQSTTGTLNWALGDYVMESVIRAGGRSTVYAARKRGVQELRALKVVSIGTDPDARTIADAERRGAELQQEFARHYGLVPWVEAIGEARSCLYVAMEFVPGEDLLDLLGRGALPPVRALDVAIQLSTFLEKTHRFAVPGRAPERIIHADLKPGNVRLRPDGHVCVLDFGIAKAMAERRIETTQKWGTRQYMSPEWLHSGTIDEQVDYWSLGVLLYEMLAGYRPFRRFERHDNQLEDAIRRRERPEALPSRVAPSLQQIVGRLLAPEIPQRYAGAADIRAALEACRPDGMLLRPLRPTRAAVHAQDARDTSPARAPATAHAVNGAEADAPRAAPVGPIAGAPLAAPLQTIAGPLQAIGAPSVGDPRARREAHDGIADVPTLPAPRGDVPTEPAPRVTAPAMTAPTVTAPTVTAPGVTAPTVTAPGVTAPAVAAPGVTASAVTGLALTGPGVTGPGEMALGEMASLQADAHGPHVADWALPPAAPPAFPRAHVVSIDADVPTLRAPWDSPPTERRPMPDAAARTAAATGAMGVGADGVALPPPADVARAASRGLRWLRRRRLLIAALWIAFAWVMASEGIACIAAERLRSDAAVADERDLTAALSRRSQLAGWTLFDAALHVRADPVLRDRLVSLADIVIGDYRQEQPTVGRVEWEQARGWLTHAVGLYPADLRLRGKLRYAEAHLQRLIGARRGEGNQVKLARQSYYTAIQKFREAAALDSRSPDPYLGLAHTYVYGLGDVENAVEALKGAEKRGYRETRRERAQIGDAYRTRGERIWRSARDLEGDQQRDAYDRAQKDFKRCVEYFTPIVEFANAADQLRRCESRLGDIEGHTTPWWRRLLDPDLGLDIQLPGAPRPSGTREPAGTTPTPATPR